MKPLRRVFKPGCEVVAFLSDCVECRIVARAIFPVKFIDGKDVVGIKAAAIKFPERQGAAGASIAIGKGVDGFKAMMEDGGGENRGE